MYQGAIILLLTLLFSLPVCAQDSYRIQQVAEGTYAAVATPGGAATSNALIVDLGTQIILCGAHFSRKAMNDLIAAATEVSTKPIRMIALTHYHPGSSLFDFAFPDNINLVTTIETRLILKQEAHKGITPLLFFKEGLSFEGTERTLILTNVGPAHSQGDMIAYLPQSKVLFASDLLYFNSVGFLGAGSLYDWVQVLDGLDSLPAEIIIPGCGPIGNRNDLQQFENYLKAFLTEILRHIEEGNSLETTLNAFSLPQYKSLPDYSDVTPENIERAYRQLKE
ncbi:MAG: hypothetical protein BA864_12020 [Desulfuromonadales bacterium C00003093]|nr:MAG: hypothetical protein BA864_12020 [Desulfuromonadales bacterium C00003093]